MSATLKATIPSCGPFHVGLFGKDDAAEDLKPVIRMVFALAAQTSNASYCPSEKPSTRTESSSTAYDIYYGGMSASTFAVVSRNEAAKGKLVWRPNYFAA